MSVLTWVFIAWGGALAYTMVGALVWRAVFVAAEHQKDYGHDLYGGCYGPTMWPDEIVCPACKYRRRAMWASLFWPIFVTAYVAFTATNALIYIPFRAAARAIAKPS